MTPRQLQATITQDRHNAAAVRKALQTVGGAATLNRLPLYYSDDDTLTRAAERTPGIKKDSRTMHGGTTIRLARR